MKHTVAIILTLLICGCRAADKGSEPFVASSTVANARTQGDIEGAFYSWEHVEKYVKSKGHDLWENIGFHLTNAQFHSRSTDIELRLAGGTARKEHEEKLELRAENTRLKDDWFSFRQRRAAHKIIAWAIGIWLGIGIASIFLGVFGFMGWSRLLTQGLLVMNPFVWIRDWIIRRRGPAEAKITIEVQQQPTPAPTVSVTQPDGSPPVEIKRE